jgi:hypothetical protein
MRLDPANRAGRIFLVWLAMQFFVVPMVLTILSIAGIVKNVGPSYALVSIPMVVIMVIALSLGERLGK